MRNLTHTTDGETLLRRYEYPDRWVVAADLHMDDEQVTVDTVGDTAIVVVDTGQEETEAEIDLPGPAAKVELNNGVLSIVIDK